jgi:hypothetical protein
MKFTRKTAVLVILAAAVLLTAVILFAGKSPRSLRTNEEMAAYLSGLGWEVESAPTEEKEVLIPDSFDSVFAAYNELQVSQGFDLSRYCGKKVMAYTFRVTNYPIDCEVLAVIYLFGGKVVAGDIHSTALDGFMHGIIRN